MSEMTKRVALAIAAELGRQDYGNPIPLSEDLMADYVDQSPVDFGLVARAAIEAMKDIPADLINTAWGFGVSDWNNVIAAALE